MRDYVDRLRMQFQRFMIGRDGMDPVSYTHLDV